nr:hypothetical protein [Vibrio parahaemolyticus]
MINVVCSNIGIALLTP